MIPTLVVVSLNTGGVCKQTLPPLIHIRVTSTRLSCSHYYRKIKEYVYPSWGNILAKTPKPHCDLRLKAAITITDYKKIPLKGSLFWWFITPERFFNLSQVGIYSYATMCERPPSPYVSTSIDMGRGVISGLWGARLPIHVVMFLLLTMLLTHTSRA